METWPTCTMTIAPAPIQTPFSMRRGLLGVVSLVFDRRVECVGAVLVSSGKQNGLRPDQDAVTACCFGAASVDRKSFSGLCEEMKKQRVHSTSILRYSDEDIGWDLCSDPPSFFWRVAAVEAESVEKSFRPR